MRKPVLPENFRCPQQDELFAFLDGIYDHGPLIGAVTAPPGTGKSHAFRQYQAAVKRRYRERQEQRRTIAFTEVVNASDELFSADDFLYKMRKELVQNANGKMTFLDRDIVESFKSQVESRGGGSYQTLMNDALRAYLERQDESLEKLLRKVVREEIRKAS